MMTCTSGTPGRSSLWRRAAALFSLGFLLLVAQPGGQAQAPPTDALPFTTSYSITGNYVVGGVDLAPASGGGGFITGTIPMSGVPANGDILAAFLYWETITTDPSQLDGALFRGEPIAVEQFASIPLNPTTAPCWSSGGGSGAVYTMTMHRADVRRYLPIQLDTNGKKTGRRLVNDIDLVNNGFALHTVTLPEAGTGNQVPSSAGASLVVIYRDPAEPLTSIVVYDGIHIQAPDTPMTQTLWGFLQSSASHVAKVTHIVGSGAKNSTERLWFDGNVPSLVPIATNPFFPGSNASSDRGWSNPTFTVTSSMPGKFSGAYGNGYGEQVSTRVDHGNTTPYDCLSSAAIIFSTTVKDTDDDGYPDILEDSATALKDPNDPSGASRLPDIHAMGASSMHKDLFVEIGAMKADAGTSYGSGVDQVTDPAGHNHLPTPAVLKMVGDAFKDSPVGNPDGSTGINVYFDVGPTYHAIPGYESLDADEYLVQTGARGGESIQEVPCVVDTENPPRWNCQFPDYPGTVTWKEGFQAAKDRFVHPDGTELTDPGGADAAYLEGCQSPGSNCRRRFDHARKDIFRYALYAHAGNIPKSLLPCRIPGVPPVPTEAQADGTCSTGQEPNPDFHVPRTTSGRGDAPGGDFMVTLGFWDNFVGTLFIQATTTMHELGHGLGRSHGGAPPQFSEVGSAPDTRALVSFEPNCKPNYLSVMSYLFQARGLFDDAGVPHLNYSGQINDPIDETLLTGGVTLGPYRTSWYAPLLPGTIGDILGTAPATKFCNFSSFPDPPPAPMVRIDGTSVAAAIDWDADGDAFEPPSLLPQDVNLDGAFEGSAAPLQGSDDWGSLRLNQVGSRRNMAGFSLGGDAYGGDAYGGDAYGGDAYGGDAYGGDAYGGDAYGGDAYGGDAYGGDAYGGDAYGGDAYGVGEELDLGAALESVSPNALHACVIGEDPACPVVGTSQPLHRIKLTWDPPSAGSDIVFQWWVYRVIGAAVTPGSIPVLVGGGPVPGSDTSRVDYEELPNGVQYTYYVIAEFDDGTRSAASAVTTDTTITAVNVAPVANDDSYSTSQGAPLVVTVPGVPPGVLDNDTDVDSASLTAVLHTGPSHGGVILNPDGSFTYTPVAGFAGTDSFSYKAKDVTPLSDANVAATVTIAVLDTTPPVVTLDVPAPNGLAGYFVTSPVTVTVSATDPSNVSSFTCFDNALPIAVGSLSGTGTTAASGSLSVSGEGTHNLTCTATDGAMPPNTGAASGSSNTGTVKIDTRPPTVTIAAPSDGASYVLNASVASSYTCSDPTPGSGLATCVGPVSSGSNFNTSTVGEKTFTVNASDAAGNSVSKTNTYLVVYNFILASYKSPANRGSAVPLTWQLKDANGTLLADLSSLVRLKSYYMPKPPSGGCTINTTGPSVQLYNPATGATGGSDFRFIQSSSSYRFNWASPSVAGCYTIEWQLKDNSGPGPDYVVLNQNALKKVSVELK